MKPLSFTERLMSSLPPDDIINAGESHERCDRGAGDPGPGGVQDDVLSGQSRHGED